jgi:multicomponent Na+:H+ antiporter subunit A
MEPSTEIVVAVAVFAPFLAAALTPLIHRGFGAWSGWMLAVVPAAAFFLLFRLLPEVAAGRDAVATFEWASAHGIALSFVVDGLSLLFALSISGIGTLILIYSGGYLKGHPHQGRFLSFLLLFTGSMLGLVLADNTIALYAFWELTTVTSFLLIGFDHARQAARRAAIQAVVVTGIGGLALLAAAVLLQRLTGSWELSGINGSLVDLAAQPAYAVVLTLVLLAAFTKSAQVPFHFWLPNAMEAPTPVSAFLHSAAMVQGGVYLLARLNPSLGGTALWTGALVAFGGVTLLWGAVQALRQTDLKQMLAQTTIASLGLLVLLLGIGSDIAVTAAVVYFAAHALYKAGLFLVVGNIDHETGTREITALGGLRDPMALSFIAAVLAAASMIGLPPVLGFFAKEEMYLATATGTWGSIAVLAVLVIGNGLLAAVALAVTLKPFMGHFVPVPKTPHEPGFSMLAGPLLLGALGIGAGFATGWLGDALLSPASSAIADNNVEAHLTLGVDFFSLATWLSVATWALAAIVYWRLERVRSYLRRRSDISRWSLDRAFDVLMFGLIRMSAAATRALHHGRLEFYFLVVFAMLAAALLAPLLVLDGIGALPAIPDLTVYEWGAIALAIAGVVAVVLAPTRLFAILALGVQGLAVAMIYLLFGAPDLSFTQFMVESLSVVILALVMTRLKLDHEDPRELEDLARDGGIEFYFLVVFAMLAAALLAPLLVLDGVFDPRLSEFFNANSAPLAHGRNVVNVIIVDFRGLDTLGEITVVMAAGIGILAMLRAARRRKERAA